LNVYAIKSPVKMIVSLFIAFFAWGLPQLALACMSMVLLLLRMPKSLHNRQNRWLGLLFLSLPALLLGFIKDYPPLEVIQASSGFTLFGIILLASLFKTKEKEVRANLKIELSRYAIGRTFQVLTLAILISTIFSGLVYLKTGSDILQFFTGDVSSSFVLEATTDEFDRAMSPLLVSTTALSFACFLSIIDQTKPRPPRYRTYQALIIFFFAINMFLSGSRGLVFTVSFFLSILVMKTMAASLIKAITKIKVTLRSIVMLILSISIMVAGIIVFLPRINSIISEILALADAIGLSLYSTDTLIGTATSTRVDAFKELITNISLFPQGFGSPLEANLYSNGPKYATEMQIPNYLRMGGALLMIWFVINLRSTKDYLPVPLSIIYASYFDFMLVFSLTNPLFFNFQVFFSLVAFAYLADNVSRSHISSIPSSSLAASNSHTHLVL